MGSPALYIEDGAGTPEVASEVVGEIPPAVTEVAGRVPPATVDAATVAVASHNYGMLFVGIGVVILVAFLVWYFTQERDVPAVA